MSSVLKLSTFKIIAASFTLIHSQYWTPPKQFDHAPKQTPIIVYTDLLSVSFACGHSVGHFNNGESRLQACALWNWDATKGHCMIILPFPYQVTKSDEEGLWKHERAHCNGWRHKGDVL